MTNNLVLCDTNIFISLFAGDIKTKKRLTVISKNCIIPIITYLELCRGAFNKNQLLKIRKNIRAYRILHFNEGVSVKTMELITKYHLSNNLSIPDAIIAASSLVFEIPLFTYNIKDFKYIEGLKLYDYN